MALTEIDRTLLKRCLSEEPGAWKDFVDRFIGLFVHVINHTAHARSVPLSPDDVEDLSAEVFVTLLSLVEVTVRLPPLTAFPAKFAFVAPNLVNDMHDPVISGAQNYTNGDQWLATQIPLITGAPAFTNRSLLVIVWDEDDLSGVVAPDDPIPMLVISALAKQSGFSSSVHRNHYALLATIEEAFGLPRLGAAAAATPLTDFFPAN